MTVPYASTGRASQKRRTRDALVAAARDLLRAGEIPTMEGAAAAASISRTTAYRYFPTVRELLAAAYPHFEQRSLLGPDPPEDPVERLELVAESHCRRILDNEAEMRAVLRLSLAGVRPPELGMHGGLRIAWIADALAPLRGRVPAAELDRLVRGIGATLGIEAFAWLTDVAGLSREDAVDVIRSNASRLLRAALAEHATGAARPPAGTSRSRSPAPSPRRR